MLSSIYSPIRTELDAAIAALGDELRHCDSALNELVGRALGPAGKRLRPALVLLCGRACGPVGPAHVQAAVVVEMVHCATLIHDDVIDNAQRRRREPTISVRWGPDVAILLGDFLFARAIELCSTFPGLRPQRILARASREMCEGEILQLLRSRHDPPDEKLYLEIVGKKSGALCGAACALGAAVAGEPDATVETFAGVGRAIGIAFQIIDDCLDIRGDENEVGKTLGTDLLLGKLTLPLIHARTHGPAPLRRQIEELLAEPPASNGRQRLTDLLERCGAFDYCDQTARSFLQQAIEPLAGLVENPVRDSLLRLADYIIERRR